MSAQLSFDLFDEASTMVDPPAPRTSTDGCGRLLKALVRAGLREDLLTVAASLVLELDAEAAER